MGKFPYSTNNYRVWWDPNTCLWNAQRWDGKGGTCRSKRFESNGLRFVNHYDENDPGAGSCLRFVDCECKAGTVIFDGAQDAVVDCLRLMPRTQHIEVPPIKMRGKIKAPRG